MTAWLALQLAQLAERNSQQPTARFNPRPPGVIREGGATEEVLAILSAQPDRFFTYGEIRAKSSVRSHAAMSWALLRLRRFGLVHVIGDGARNSRFLRYRVNKKVNE